MSNTKFLKWYFQYICGGMLKIIFLSGSRKKVIFQLSYILVATIFSLITKEKTNYLKASCYLVYISHKNKRSNNNNNQVDNPCNYNDWHSKCQYNNQFMFSSADMNMLSSK